MLKYQYGSNPNTINFVDRVMIIRKNEDLEIEVLLDSTIIQANKPMYKNTIAYSKLFGAGRNNINPDKIPVINMLEYEGYKIIEYENGNQHNTRRLGILIIKAVTGTISLFTHFGMTLV